ncbi:MAG: hypothetical protein U9M97_01915 [Candidatus Hadarchaeota archaeon]|nr:hypothetical protein [Candidatus Hadarchaeota archaeon]
MIWVLLSIILKGKIHGMVDAIAIEKVTKKPEGWLQVKKLTTEQLRTVEVLAKTVFIHHGEAEAVVLAHDLCVPLLIDDRVGRKVAEVLYGIKRLGTIAVLLDAVWSELMNERGAKTLLDKIIAEGFNLDAQTYAEFCRRLGKTPESGGGG